MKVTRTRLNLDRLPDPSNVRDTRREERRGERGRWQPLADFAKHERILSPSELADALARWRAEHGAAA